MGLIVYQQAITAGNNFNGTAPAGNPTAHDQILKDYPAAAAGGLFDFGLLRPGYIVQVQLKLGGQASWKVELEDVDNDKVTLYSGTNEASFISPAADRILLLAGQKLLVTTAGASGALKARVAVSDSAV